MPRVDSSNISQIEFDQEGHRLLVTFVSNGAVYEYPGATEELYQEFLASSSKGRFLRQVVIPKLGKGSRIS